MTSQPIESLAATAAPSAAVLAQLADALAWPLLLLRPEGTLLHANRAARLLLRTARPMWLDEQRRLRLSPARLQAELDAALLAAPGQQEPVLLRWPGAQVADPAITATLSWLRPQRSNQPPCVLLALTSGESHDDEVAAFARLHTLTRAEHRVLGRLALGESAVAAARALGVTPSTVRSQILTLRHKTGHASVSELLRALSRMPPVAKHFAPLPDGE
jgi:DNA-binding CsgD family transcriptional regulator